MTELQIFNNPEFGDIRTLMIEDEPWWVGRDVANALKYDNTRKAIRDHIDDDDKQEARNVPLMGSGVVHPMTIFINESGLYSLILSSKLPSAKRFKRWITSEVLPALRKTGKYEISPPTAEQRQLTVDDYIRAASIIAGCRNERIPAVMALLEKSGISIPSLEDIEGKARVVSEYEETGETASLINEAINDYGIKQAKIASLCGLHPTQIMRIRTGEQKPRKDRARIIQDVIRKEMARTE